MGRPGLRWWHCCARDCWYGCCSVCHVCRVATQPRGHPPQHSPHGHRHSPPVVRLVRFQCRLCPQCGHGDRRHRLLGVRSRVCQHGDQREHSCARVDAAGLDHRRQAQADGISDWRNCRPGHHYPCCWLRGSVCSHCDWVSCRCRLLAGGVAQEPMGFRRRSGCVRRPWCWRRAGVHLAGPFCHGQGEPQRCGRRILRRRRGSIRQADRGGALRILPLLCFHIRGPVDH
mmetsp:Transcript_13443/g.38787  ORF Transcript_13443/g.38787 Transcript_13443/m.38787 type:complete len:229 (-) Transcript_13443:3247-3933(-)